MIKIITDTSTHYYYEKGDTVRELSTNKVYEVTIINRGSRTLTTTTGVELALTPDVKPTEETLKGCKIDDKRRKELDINVKYHDSNMPPLTRIEQGDWTDVRVVSVKINGQNIDWENDTITYKKEDYVQAYLGFALELPLGYEAHVAPRGSTFKNYGLLQTNSVGVVDESYKGNNDIWFVPFYATRSGEFKKYDRIAQFRVMRKMPVLNFTAKDNLDNADRGGHGSTGTN